jgi:hypothetical protein
MPRVITMHKTTDLSFDNHGSLVLVSSATEEGQDWLDEHCPRGDDHTYFGDDLVVEARYTSDLFEAAKSDGLTVS